jgi:collagenase-like PrtC family protease
VRIALGPVLYYWPREQLLDFYAHVCGAPVDVVYLGETVCSKRRPLKTDDWLALARDVADSGKEVVLSTLTLIEAASELSNLRRLCDNGRFRVEANDYAAVQRLSELGVPFVAGPTMNIYNAHTLRVLHASGLRRWVPPVEMPRDTVSAMAEAAHALSPAVETEVFAYGRMPLAFSARCFAARAENRPKDDCGFVCLNDPEGRTMTTQEGDTFLTINGIQTQSGRRANLLPYWLDLQACGAELLRVSPTPKDTLPRLALLRAALDTPDTASATAPLEEADTVSGYWWGTAGLDPATARE